MDASYQPNPPRSSSSNARANPEVVKSAMAALKNAQADYQLKLKGEQPPDTSPHTFVYAAEIEEGVVSIAWHEPWRMAIIYRELDPAVHFTQPHLQYLLEAIDLAYRDLGDVSWQAVIQVLRETRHLEDCGGLEGCNQIYRIEEEGSDLWAERTEKVFRHYLEMLKTYAVHRKMDPPRPVYQFLGSKATLYLNKVKRSDSAPDYLGEIQFKGRPYSVKIWRSLDGEFLNLSLQPL